MKIIEKFVEIYLNDDFGKVKKFLNDCKSLIFLVLTLCLIDSFHSSDAISLNFIFDNMKFANRSIEILFFGSRLFLSLCCLSILMMFISCILLLINFIKFKEKSKTEIISSFLFGISLRLVSSSEYLFILLFIGYLFDRNFLFDFINSYRFSPFWFETCLIVAFLLLFCTVILRRILSFFLYFGEKNVGDKTLDDELDYTKCFFIIYQYV